MESINLGIIGPGKIAKVIANAINNTQGIEKYAVASRNLERAENFADEFGFKKAFGSYEEMLKDDNIDLVYIATPHSFHYQQMLMCIENNINILCEKAFCLNKEQAIEVIDKARKMNIFLCEALCTAFLPSRKIIYELIQSKIIGEIKSCHAVFGASLLDVERVVTKELGGGALLDIGIYPLYFCLSTFGYDCVIEDIDMKMYNDVDESETVILKYPSGLKCQINASMRDNLGMYADIYGTKGKIHIENIARPEHIEIYDENDNLIKRINNLRDTTGYEYELMACKNAINQNKLETNEMSHNDTLRLMDFMDRIFE